MNKFPKCDYCPAAIESLSPNRPAGRDRYSVALNAALQILEDVDTLPKSNLPVRLGVVIGHVLDAIYAADSEERS